jgi:hypothetical protein
LSNPKYISDNFVNVFVGHDGNNFFNAEKTLMHYNTFSFTLLFLQLLILVFLIETFDLGSNDYNCLAHMKPHRISHLFVTHMPLGQMVDSDWPVATKEYEDVSGTEDLSTKD